MEENSNLGGGVTEEESCDNRLLVEMELFWRIKSAERRLCIGRVEPPRPMAIWNNHSKKWPTLIIRGDQEGVRNTRATCLARNMLDSGLVRITPHHIDYLYQI